MRKPNRSNLAVGLHATAVNEENLDLGQIERELARLESRLWSTASVFSTPLDRRDSLKGRTRPIVR